jgi:hypothetical protein
VEHTCAAWIHADNVEASIGPIAAEIGACAVWVPVWAFDASERVLAVCVGEEGDLCDCGGKAENSEGDKKGEERSGQHLGGRFAIWLGDVMASWTVSRSFQIAKVTLM